MASSSSRPPAATYQVFLSFRGPDTRQGFTDVLYHALVDAGVHVFRDNEEIRKGEEISREILRAIEESGIFVPIFSRGYASSKWCLLELTKMVELKEGSSGKKILPIFYDVGVDDVKLKTNLYTEALKEHSKMFGAETVKLWEEALRQAGRFNGWELEDKGHAECAKLVVRDVSMKLKVKHKCVTEYLVQRDDQVEALMKLLGCDSSEVQFVGIFGMGGIGKTTLATVVFNKLCNRFDGCSFLDSVRESSGQRKGIESLQKQLLQSFGIDAGGIMEVGDGIIRLKETLGSKKVLIVLDDVDSKEQIRNLAGDASWFGPGSRIIITTRDQSVLEMRPLRIKTLDVEELNPEEAYRLFCMHAFGKDSPLDDYISVSKEAVKTTGGLPLALAVIGSFLRDKPREEWPDTIERLEEVPHKDVQRQLMISYEALSHETKQIFLDIACFFIGHEERYPIYMWQACNFDPKMGVKELVTKSLLKIILEEDVLSRVKRKTFWMHDQLRDLGRNIVKSESLKDDLKPSRLWSHENPSLLGEEGAEHVEMLYFRYNEYTLTQREISSLKKLRYLKCHGANFSGKLTNTLPKLRWLSWSNCPPEFMGTGMFLRNLVILDLSCSFIDENWSGWIQIEVGTTLKALDLRGCKLLRRTPDLSVYSSLERLVLDCCDDLIEIDPSIGKLARLRHLSLAYCHGLRALPDTLGDMKSLVELDISETGINELPYSIRNLENLKLQLLNGIAMVKNDGSVEFEVPADAEPHYLSVKQRYMDNEVVDNEPLDATVKDDGTKFSFSYFVLLFLFCGCIEFEVPADAEPQYMGVKPRDMDNEVVDNEPLDTTVKDDRAVEFEVQADAEPHYLGVKPIDMDNEVVDNEPLDAMVKDDGTVEFEVPADDEPHYLGVNPRDMDNEVVDKEPLDATVKDDETVEFEVPADAEPHYLGVKPRDMDNEVVDNEPLDATVKDDGIVGFEVQADAEPHYLGVKPRDVDNEVVDNEHLYATVKDDGTVEFEVPADAEPHYLGVKPRDVDNEVVDNEPLDATGKDDGTVEFEVPADAKPHYLCVKPRDVDNEVVDNEPVDATGKDDETVEFEVSADAELHYLGVKPRDMDNEVVDTKPLDATVKDDGTVEFEVPTDVVPHYLDVKPRDMDNGVVDNEPLDATDLQYIPPLEIFNTDRSESTSVQDKLEKSKTARQRPHNVLAEEAARIFDNNIPVQQKLQLLNRIATVKDDGTVEFEVPADAEPHDLGVKPRDMESEVVDNEHLDATDFQYIPPLQIVMLIVGTRGDVQPFAAIGIRLQDYGHRVRLATHSNFKEFVLTAGLEFYPLGGDPKVLAGYMVKNKGFLPSGPSEIPIQRNQTKEIINSLLAACKDPDIDSGVPFKVDAIIANPPAYGHTHVAEALKVPLHVFYTMPWTPTSEFPHPLYRVKQQAGYRLSYQIVDSLIWLGVRDMINDVRKKKLKLRPVTYLSGSQGSDSDVPYGYIWSPHLVPKPKDWGPKVDVVGFCFLDLASNYEPPEELVKWLQAGEKPIYIGFGSLPVVDPEKMTQVIVGALETTGQRGIINKGWGGLGNLAEPKEFIYLLDNVPHDWLFLQCKAVVHHGGAGTTAAGLRAACPTTIVPFFGDQLFWGERVHARGVGPPPIPVDEFSLPKLVDAITFMLDPQVKERAVQLAKAMEYEDGVTGAVKAFFKHLPYRKPDPEPEQAPSSFFSSISRSFGWS